MMRLTQLGFLAAGTRRSLAYIAAMERVGIFPEAALLMAGGGQRREAAEALDRAGIAWTEIAADDVNAPAVTEAIARSNWRIVLFSGPPGAIVRAPLFATGRRFLHVHPGALPGYRGSTTIYYSILDHGAVAATALYLDAGIDTGPILAARSFAPPLDRRTIDHEFDPLIRATVLEDVLRALAIDALTEQPQDSTTGRTHYIIHPVLKHIAILAGGGDTK